MLVSGGEADERDRSTGKASAWNPTQVPVDPDGHEQLLLVRNAVVRTMLGCERCSCFQRCIDGSHLTLADGTGLSNE